MFGGATWTLRSNSRKEGDGIEMNRGDAETRRKESREEAKGAKEAM